MSVNTLSVPVLEINNEVIAYKPNSIKCKLGIGEVKVTTQVAGPFSVQAVLSEDAETRIGEVTVEIENTPSNIKLIRRFKESTSNSILLYGPGLTISYSGMALTNDPEIELSSDGGFELMFEGDQGIAS